MQGLVVIASRAHIDVPDSPANTAQPSTTKVPAESPSSPSLPLDNPTCPRSPGGAAFPNFFNTFSNTCTPSPHRSRSTTRVDPSSASMNFTQRRRTASSVKTCALGVRSCSFPGRDCCCCWCAYSCAGDATRSFRGDSAARATAYGCPALDEGVRAWLGARMIPGLASGRAGRGLSMNSRASCSLFGDGDRRGDTVDAVVGDVAGGRSLDVCGAGTEVVASALGVASLT